MRSRGGRTEIGSNRRFIWGSRRFVWRRGFFNLVANCRGDVARVWLRLRDGNRFLVNVQPEQVQPVSDFLAQAGVARPILYPMIRGRLVIYPLLPVLRESGGVRA